MSYPAEFRSQALVSAFKTWDEVKEYVLYGNADFIVLPEYWQGPPPVPCPHAVPIPAWGTAVDWGDRGFYVYANSIEELGGYLSYLVEANKDAPQVYFRVSVAGVPTPRSTVDIYIRMELMGGYDI
jgi:hypothetical protein